MATIIYHKSFLPREIVLKLYNFSDQVPQQRWSWVATNDKCVGVGLSTRVLPRGLPRKVTTKNRIQTRHWKFLSFRSFFLSWQLTILRLKHKDVSSHPGPLLNWSEGIRLRQEGADKFSLPIFFFRWRWYLDTVWLLRLCVAVAAQVLQPLSA